jgi:glycosyltransferase involved in cell wall biosynthesis
VKIILFANTDWYLFKFRIAQARALRELGVDLTLVSPPGTFSPELEKMGYHWLPFPLSRSGMNPLSEAAAIRRLVRLYRRERPDLVHHFTIKSILYGSLAAKAAGVKAVVNGVTGLGYVFSSGSPARRLLRLLVETWYRLALRGTQAVFDNDEDRRFFVSRKLIRMKDAHVVRSAGVDVELYAPAPEPEGVPVIMLAGRMLWDKGIREYVEAARLLRRDGVPARLVLVGEPDAGNPASITREQLQAWEASGEVEWWGFRADMPSVFRQVNIVCLPSYREGLPTTLIEAGACGRAVVATDVTGCRDAVRDGITGLLVPAKDAAALAAGLMVLLRDPSLRRKMGEAGRKMAVNEFSTGRVNRDTWQVYAQAGLEVTE